MTINEELMRAALHDVSEERFAQDGKWGTQRHTWPEWLCILGEEFGEASTEANKAYWGWTEEERQERIAKLRQELVQTAAVAVAIIEHIDSGEGVVRD